jgi:tetratricopeptide (TPR) repeat protein
MLVKEHRPTANPLAVVGFVTPFDVFVADVDMIADEFFQRGLKSAQLGFPDRAATDFEEAAWLEPDNQEVQFNLGTAYLSMGDFEQAINNFTRVIEMNPEGSDAYGNRAVAHTAIGEDDKSEKDVEEAIRLGAPPDGLAAIIEYVKTQRK